jgi:hypothetical protein
VATFALIMLVVFGIAATYALRRGCQRCGHSGGAAQAPGVVEQRTRTADETVSYGGALTSGLATAVRARCGRERR